MASITFNISAFRVLYPTLANLPDATLNAYFGIATDYVSNRLGGCYIGGLSPAQKALALNQMTAHLVYLANITAAGSTPGILTGATIDKVSVTLEPPPQTNQWQWWLNQSPYGQQLLALLQLAGVGGIYATTAAPGRAGFRFGGIG